MVTLNPARIDTSLPAPGTVTSPGITAHLSAMVDAMSMATVALTCLDRSEARSLTAVVGGTKITNTAAIRAMVATQAMVETAVAMALDTRAGFALDEEMM